MYSFLARAEAVAEHLWLRLRLATACTERLVLSEVEVNQSSAFGLPVFMLFQKPLPDRRNFNQRLVIAEDNILR